MREKYAVAVLPTPILNRPDFSKVFHPDGVVLDSLGLLKAQEMIAFPKTLFTIIRKHPNEPYIYEVTTKAYPVTYPLYVDSRCLEFISQPANYIQPRMPSKKSILKHFETLIGKPYVWGGNYSQGIPQFLQWYPSKSANSKDLDRINRTMEGVDCSGMLYEATLGLTPRNTSWLVDYGRAVLIDGLTSQQIKENLQPLDMILWSGHIVFVLDKEHTIESRAHRGCVFVTPLSERLFQIEEEEKKTPMDSKIQKGFKETGFIIRRML